MTFKRGNECHIIKFDRQKSFGGFTVIRNNYKKKIEDLNDKYMKLRIWNVLLKSNNDKENNFEDLKKNISLVDRCSFTISSLYVL